MVFSYHTQSFARLFFLKQLFSTNLKPRKYKISSFKTWNPLRVKKLAAHHIAWLGIYSFGPLGPKTPNPGPKVQLWNPFARDWILTSLKGSSIMDPPAAVSEETNGNGTADQVDGLNLKKPPRVTFANLKWFTFHVGQMRILAVFTYLSLVSCCIPLRTRKIQPHFLTWCFRARCWTQQRRP